MKRLGKPPCKDDTTMKADGGKGGSLQVSGGTCSKLSKAQVQRPWGHMPDVLEEKAKRLEWLQQNESTKFTHISVFKVNSGPLQLLSPFSECILKFKLLIIPSQLLVSLLTFFSTTHRLHTSRMYVLVSGSEPAFLPPNLDNSHRAELSSEFIKCPACGMRPSESQYSVHVWGMTLLDCCLKELHEKCCLQMFLNFSPINRVWVFLAAAVSFRTRLTVDRVSLSWAQKPPTFLWCNCWPFVHINARTSYPPPPSPLVPNLLIEMIVSQWIK